MARLPRHGFPENLSELEHPGFNFLLWELLMGFALGFRYMHFFSPRNSVLAPVLKISYEKKVEFKSINYDLKNNVNSHPQNSNKKLANIQEEPKKIYISSYF